MVFHFSFVCIEPEQNVGGKQDCRGKVFLRTGATTCLDCSVASFPHNRAGSTDSPLPPQRPCQPGFRSSGARGVPVSSFVGRGGDAGGSRSGCASRSTKPSFGPRFRSEFRHWNPALDTHGSCASPSSIEGPDTGALSLRKPVNRLMRLLNWHFPLFCAG